MSTARSRFRRGRGDQNPGDIDPAFAPRPQSEPEVSTTNNDSLNNAPPSNQLENFPPSSQSLSEQQPLIDESLFPAVGENPAPMGGVDTALLGNPGEDDGTGFGNIPQRQIRERSNSNVDEQRPKSRKNNANPDAPANNRNDGGMFSWFNNKEKAASVDQKKGNEGQSSTNNQNNEQSNADEKAQETGANKPSHDLSRYYRRMEYLKSLQQNIMIYPFYKCSRMLWMGYDNEEFKRFVPFSKAYPWLDLATYSKGWSLGIVLRTIDTFRQNIIGLVKPIVKVHVLDIETGMYIKSAEMPPTRPVFTGAITATDSGSSAKWDEEVTFEADYADIVSEKSVILFEIIDERPFLSTGRSTFRNKRIHHYKKIAWGYLLPIGTDGRLNVGLANRRESNGETSINRSNDNGNPNGNENEKDTGGDSSKVPKLRLPTTDFNKVDEFESMKTKDVSLRIQLHYYREYDGLIGIIQRSVLTWSSLNESYESPAEANYPNKIPPIYLQWRMLRKQTVDGAFLRISIGSRVKKIRKADTHRTVESEPELAGPTTARSKKEIKASAKGKKKRKKLRSKEERTKLRAAAMRRTRGPKDPCIVPDKFLNRIEVGPEGAMVTAFSNSGHVLAIASRTFVYHGTGLSTEITYCLRLYDTDLDEEIWAEEVAHHSVIYDLKWSKNDRFLVTCSGDGTCKVWDFLSFSPCLSQYSTAYYAHQTALNRHRMAGQTGADDDTYVGTQLATARTANTYNTAGNPAGPDFHLHDEMSPSNITKLYPPQVIHVLPLPAHVVSYCAVFQEFNNTPFVLPSPAMQFKDDALTMGELNYYIEQLNILKASYAPRVIIGCSDGRIRVFDSGRFMGYVMVNGKDDTGKQKDFSPHDGVVNAVVIDERSKYLISADSFGDILAWRLDGKGWYQLLRKFKRDVGLHDPALVEHFDNGSVLSLAMHPDKLKGLMLVLSRQPSVLRVVNMSTYKPLSYCEGFTGISANVVREEDDSLSTGVFHRAQFTADGKYIVCCVQDTQNKQHFRLMFWETYTGHLVPSPLSKMTFPYPIRSITWHPTQHLVAIAMTGPAAAVNLYSADQDSPTEVYSYSATNASQLGIANTLNGGDDIFRRSTNSLSRSVTSLGMEAHGDALIKSPDKKNSLPTINEGQSSKSQTEMTDIESKEARAERTKAILAKVRASKAAK